MKSSIITFFLFFFSCLNAQQFSGKIIDEKTQEGIPFATVQTGEHTGVISNESGFFTINLDNKTELKLSCMGYQTVTIDITTITQQNNIISLKEAVNELDAVFLNKTKPDVEEIITNVINNIQKNYKTDLHKHRVFTRSKSGFNVKKINFEVKKATGFKKRMLEDANKSLDSMANIIRDVNSVDYTDVLGDLYVKDLDSAKLDVIKATVLIDRKNNFSAETLEDKFRSILFRYLNKDKTYKVKTGLFKIEDSLSFQDILEKEKEEKINEIQTSNLRYTPMDFVKQSNLNTETKIRQFLDTDLYEYKLDDMIYFNDDIIYIISFTPDRAKAKFSGTLYIKDGDYALLKADYAYGKGKRGEKFNLRLIFGVKYIDNHRKGTIMFHKVDNYYLPQYAMEENGEYIYIHRPLKFKENGFQKNNVLFDCLVEGNTFERSEALFKDTEKITESSFDKANESKKTPYQELKRYNPDIWKVYNVIEPLEDMKNFSVKELP